MNKNPFAKLRTWHSRVLKYLVSHPDVKFIHEFLYFNPGTGLDAIIHLDKEGKTIGMHVESWSSKPYIENCLEEACKKNGINFMPGFLGGYVKIKVSKFYPRKIKKLFYTVTAVYEIQKQLECK